MMKCLLGRERRKSIHKTSPNYQTKPTQEVTIISEILLLLLMDTQKAGRHSSLAIDRPRKSQHRISTDMLIIKYFIFIFVLRHFTTTAAALAEDRNRDRLIISQTFTGKGGVSVCV